MEGKRIVFSTGTPNDQGGVIPNEAIDFSRYKANPVVLCQHQWNDPPLGIMTDIKLEGGKWTGIPVFHGLTKESAEYAAMYDSGHLRACSIGGEAEWKQNASGQPELTKDGLRQCENFKLYEISMVSLPSNPDAVSTLTTKIYEKTDLQKVFDTITTLSSSYKIPSMEPVKKTPAQVKLEAAQAKLEAVKAEVIEAEKTVLASNDPSNSQLPGIIQEIIKENNASHVGVIGTLGGIIKDLFVGKKDAKPETLSVPEPKDKPESSLENPTQPQPTPIGLAAEEAKKKAEESVRKAEKAKEAAEKNDATEEEKSAYSLACTEMEAAMKECESAQAAYEAEKNGSSLAAKTLKTANVAPEKPVLKLRSMTELQAAADNAKIKLAPKPEDAAIRTAKVLQMRGTSFTELSSKKNEEGARILGRVLTSDGGQKSLEDYQVVLESIMRDGKYAAITEKMRVLPNIGQF
jgi:hypothetical protein